MIPIKTYQNGDKERFQPFVSFFLMSSVNRYPLMAYQKYCAADCKIALNIPGPIALSIRIRFVFKILDDFRPIKEGSILTI